MSVSAELLCSFELLKPLDSSALKQHIKKSRNKRQSMLNSPVRTAVMATNPHAALDHWPSYTLAICNIVQTRAELMAPNCNVPWSSETV